MSAEEGDHVPLPPPEDDEDEVGAGIVAGVGITADVQVVVESEGEEEQVAGAEASTPLSNDERRELYFELNQCKAENESRATEVSILKRQLMQLLQLVQEASAQNAAASGTSARAGDLQKVVESLAVSENRLLRTILQDVRRKHSEEVALMVGQRGAKRVAHESRSDG